MMTESFVPMGAVLVVEIRTCLHCKRKYIFPARQLAQLYLTPANRAHYSIEALEPAKIIGQPRTMYWQQTTSERCIRCFRINTQFVDIPQLPLPANARATIATEDDYAIACSKRDLLRKQVEAAEIALEKAQKKLHNVRGEYNIAYHAVRNLARVHWQEQRRKYSTSITKPRPERKPIVPMRLEDI